MADNTSVKVALRIRPLVTSEISRGCSDILEVFPDINQVRIRNTEKAFTFNNVFPSDTTQSKFYETCIQKLTDNLFKGYNVTILAYGQTGSGKTHSMGTTYNGEGDMGVIPRAVHDIFNFVKDNFAYDFSVSVSFMELYQEVLYDLFSTKSRDQCVVEIREDTKGIIIPNLTEIPVNSAFETLSLLAKGSSGRAVGSTNMNAQSSRSHAIFTISICMQKKDNSNSNRTAKFHLVDLAGSERSKKTGATGQTFKEGVNINKGLLALGNVISALGDDKLQGGYISYRDSNLTRLLKDSLGGNSITLMIACVSPADYNMEETLSTLRYADRARKIKNTPIVNEDPRVAEINRLNKLVNQLRLEIVGQGGPIICQAELELLKKENTDLKVKNRDLTFKLSNTLLTNTDLQERLIMMQEANEHFKQKLNELKEEYNVTLNDFHMSLEMGDVNGIKEKVNKLEIIQRQFQQIDAEQKKNELELRNHQEQSVRKPLNPNVSISSEVEVNEQQECHTANQIKLNNELQKVTEELAMKEHLIEQIAQNTYHMVDYSAITENEDKIKKLENEKDQLLAELRAAHTSEMTGKIAEQRRKKVQELESQIRDLQRKVQEQARLIKMKEKDELKIKNLNKEIVEMKQMKVKLIRTMKQESDKFRSWKLQKERDLIKLKEQGRKQENAMIQMKTKYDKAQNVWRRKAEEAAAINKRLKDVLALRKLVQENKNSGKLEKIAQWVQQEVEIYSSYIDAKQMLQGLIEDRACLSSRLNELKSLEDVSTAEDIRKLEEDIELRTTQINGLQQKLCDSDEEEKSKVRWESLQTMAEAKTALSSLFKRVGVERENLMDYKNKVYELQATVSELEGKSEQLQKEKEHLIAAHRYELSQVEKEAEQKVSVLLKELRGKAVDDVETHQNQHLLIVQQNNESLEKINEKLIKENEELKEKIVDLESKSSGVTKVKRSRTKKSADSTYLAEPSKVYLTVPDVIDSPTWDEDNVAKDPDWHKTPLAKRTRSRAVVHKTKDEKAASKRTSEGGCGCRGICSQNTCSCRKRGQPCFSGCKCKSVTCVNRTIDEVENETVNNSTDDEKSFIKKPSSGSSSRSSIYNRPHKMLILNGAYCKRCNEISEGYR